MTAHAQNIRIKTHTRESARTPQFLILGIKSSHCITNSTPKIRNGKPSDSDNCKRNCKYKLKQIKKNKPIATNKLLMSDEMIDQQNPNKP